MKGILGGLLLALVALGCGHYGPPERSSAARTARPSGPAPPVATAPAQPAAPEEEEPQ